MLNALTSTGAGPEATQLAPALSQLTQHPHRVHSCACVVAGVFTTVGTPVARERRVAALVRQDKATVHAAVCRRAWAGRGRLTARARLLPGYMRRGPGA